MASGLSSINPLQSDLPPSGHPSFISPSAAATPPQSLLETKGIPLECFIEDLDQQFICVHCKKGLRWAMQTSCGCRSCYGCLQRYIKEQGDSLKCPSCGDEFSKDDIAKDSFARKKMEQCKMYCANKSRGCKEQVPLKKMDEHLQQECNYELINCMHRSKGCLQRVQRNQLVQHLEKECAFRRQKCRYCGDDFVKNELELHEKECKKFLDKCPNNCGERLIHKDKIPDHLKYDCPLQDKVCIFNMFGCSFSAKGIDRKMDLHTGENQVYHLQLVTEHIIRMDKQLQELNLLKNNLEKMVAKPTASEQMQVPAKAEKQMMRDLQKMIMPLMEKVDNVEDNMNQLAKQKTVSELEESIKPIQEKQNRIENRIVELEQAQKTGSVGSNAGESSAPLTMTGVTTSALSASSSRMTTVENQMGMHAVRIAEHDLRFQVLETASHDGTLLWKIKDFARRKRDADIGKTLSLYSQPFYTSRYGYKMCARVYLNGDGMGKGTHVSLFFVVMRGDYDALLPWPFRQKVTLMLLDQDTGRRHLSDSFRPDPASSSFGRPTTEMNIASGCPLFVSQSVLSDSAYVKDNVMFIKVIVDASDVVKP
ncbi:TNF receptor-associated factor 3-like [Patiria miniata]|uniref:TNF receptor-associated factor 3 n=1 Tax=Patiria miniata TaxID=46514 RepID=A0A914B825_PATMI|nr:TNF receptor-associated factor 3-like [Patiria miniata]